MTKFYVVVVVFNVVIAKRRAWKPTPYSCLENPHGQRSLLGYTPRGHKESDTTERLSLAVTKWPLLHLPSIFPGISIFSNELVLLIRWLKYWSFSLRNSLTNECSGLMKRKEKGVAEDEMIRKHHRLNGHEFAQTLGDGGGQGSLVGDSPWGSQRVGHDLVSEQQQEAKWPSWTHWILCSICLLCREDKKTKTSVDIQSSYSTYTDWSRVLLSRLGVSWGWPVSKLGCPVFPSVLWVTINSKPSRGFSFCLSDREWLWLPRTPTAQYMIGCGSWRPSPSWRVTCSCRRRFLGTGAPGPALYIGHCLLRLCCRAGLTLRALKNLGLETPSARLAALLRGASSCPSLSWQPAPKSAEFCGVLSGCTMCPDHAMGSLIFLSKVFWGKCYWNDPSQTLSHTLLWLPGVPRPPLPHAPPPAPLSARTPSLSGLSSLPRAEWGCSSAGPHGPRSIARNRTHHYAYGYIMS